jgi:hypothetical protein
MTPSPEERLPISEREIPARIFGSVYGDDLRQRI